MSQPGESWVESAQNRALGRPLAALPFCVFRGRGEEKARVGVGIGDRVLDLGRCAGSDLLHGLSRELITACGEPVLNRLIACGAADQAALRTRLTGLLGSESHRATTERALLRLDTVELLKPVDVPNFTDFYASIEHAENVGRMFRPEQPLLPNYRHVPIGYHGRASSVVVSGTPVRRPWGQVRGAGEAAPEFVPTRQLDYEMEIGAYVCGGNALGEPVGIDAAAGQIFGLTLVNDWSARDVQSWEYKPLGPFLGKSFVTSVGAWVVPWAALEPYREAVRERRAGEPEPLGYLREAGSARGAVDLVVEAWLETELMRGGGMAPVLLGRSNMAGLYWTLPQMIAHHTSNGCNLLAGDLLATGTISGAGEGARGCLLERTRGGAAPLRLSPGEERTFMEDGDTVMLRGFCEREGLPRVSLGECRGTVMPARVVAG